MNKQAETWLGIAGEEYTDRWSCSIEDWEAMYETKFGITRTEMNSHFLLNMDRNVKILEVGCNVGQQLRVLKRMGFINLYGIELQPYAVNIAKKEFNNVIEGNAFDIPFKSCFFDMVFTSGVLIHFVEKDLKNVMAEIYRCSSKYIWGYEYWNPTFKEINWRGKENMMFAADYVKYYQEYLPLKLVKEEHFKYLSEPWSDTMFLLEKA